MKPYTTFYALSFYFILILVIEEMERVLDPNFIGVILVQYYIFIFNLI